MWVRKFKEDFSREVGQKWVMSDGKIWRERGEEKPSRLGWRRAGWEYMMHVQDTVNRPTYFEHEVYVGKY